MESLRIMIEHLILNERKTKEMWMRFENFEIPHEEGFGLLPST